MLGLLKFWRVQIINRIPFNLTYELYGRLMAGDFSPWAVMCMKVTEYAYYFFTYSLYQMTP